MSNRDLQLKEQRAVRAEQILNDELVKSAFHDIRKSLVDKITKSAFKEQELREDCYMMLRVVDSFEGQFKRHIKEGQIAKDTLAMKIVKRIQEA